MLIVENRMWNVENRMQNVECRNVECRMQKQLATGESKNEGKGATRAETSQKNSLPNLFFMQSTNPTIDDTFCW